MKNIVRAFVVVLAITGAAASTRVSANSAGDHSSIALTKATAFPIPTCPLDDPNACGMGGPPSVR